MAFSVGEEIVVSGGKSSVTSRVKSIALVGVLPSSAVKVMMVDPVELRLGVMSRVRSLPEPLRTILLLLTTVALDELPTMLKLLGSVSLSITVKSTVRVWMSRRS